MLRLFNSFTGREEDFQPIEPGIVRMYVCGDTVYDFCHIGHARSKVAFDVVRRYLQYRGFAVTFVRNITDIDDKIIKRAAENNESVQALTERFTAAMHEDYDRLGILRPDEEPKATGHIPTIVGITQKLIDKGYAYVAPNGDVMYSVAKFEPYGRLSGKRLEDLRAGSRVAVDEAKRDPLDFVLWKRAKPGEPSWPSPWGEGRPGWHIECSAMTYDLLGPRFDIHGGGADLKFPHHENEIAQSCAATGEDFAKYWMHNGFVNVDNEKMSKSLGNFFRIRDVIGAPDGSGPRFVRDPEVLRFFLISSHYRGPINYSLQQLEQADATLVRLYTVLRDVGSAQGQASMARGAQGSAVVGKNGEHDRTSATHRFEAAMDDDFNTPQALAVLQSLAGDINRLKAAGDASTTAAMATELKRLGAVLGVLQQAPDVFLRKPVPHELDEQGERGATQPDAGLSDADIERRIAQRAAARKSRDFKESDRIRDELATAGVILEDKPGTTSWRRT